jgi:subfamily B ATP-binding cassette protein MsbA
VNSLEKLWPYLRPHWPLLVGSIILAFPLAALRASPVKLVQYLFDDVLPNRDEKMLLIFPLLVVGIFVLNFIVRFLHYFWNRLVVARVNFKIKKDLFQHLLSLSADYFTDKSTGTLISRVAADPNQVDAGIHAFSMIIREPLTFIMLFSWAFSINWKLTLITLLTFPFLALVFMKTGKFLKRYGQRLAEENARLFSTLQESFVGIRMIKAFRLEPYVQEKFDERLTSFKSFMVKTAVIEEAAHPAVELFTSFAIAGVIYFGGTQVLRGEMTSGELLSFFTAFGLMMNPLRMMNDINIKLNQTSVVTDRIFEILSWKPNLYQSPSPQEKLNFSGSLQFQDVWFHYPDNPERWILRGVSFELKKGHALALVGASGAGKSSTVNLLPRIFDVQKGQITIDGTDIRELKLGDLRSLIAVVSQDVFLFNDTIEENIRCGRLGASFEDIKNAARRANAEEFIERLPLGYKTVIGDRGQKLSGGERQRLSIARAFLRESPILILDEATSSLDSASERAVQSALEELMHNRTTIVIAHRLSTIQHIEQILVMRAGEVCESGRHDELVGKQGEYARFLRLLEAGN